MKGNYFENIQHSSFRSNFLKNSSRNTYLLIHFTDITWNIRELGEKEEEVDKILNENNIKIAVITESKNKIARMMMMCCISLEIINIDQ